MRAVVYHGKEDFRVDNVEDAKIEDPKDAVIRITSTAICGSDLHMYAGGVPMMEEGDIIGHEPMGIVEAVGSEVTRLKKGDRVVVPFTISCGDCWFCNKQMFSLCDESNREAEKGRKMMGHAAAGIFGYSHMTGGYAGGQAEALRVPYADVGPIKIESDLPDEKVLFLSDIFPTGYMAAENAEIEEGDTVAVWGCGPVGQFAIQSAWMLGAGRVIAIDREPTRLAMAATHGKAETIDFSEKDVYETLQEMTGGRGPDRCIDAVGAEAHGSSGLGGFKDTVKEALGIDTDNGSVIFEMIRCCRKGGTMSMPGVYLDVVPVQMGAFMNKGLTWKTGQTHVQKYLRPLLEKIETGAIDPSFVITHPMNLSDAAEGYRTFAKKEDGCVKVVLTP